MHLRFDPGAEQADQLVDDLLVVETAVVCDQPRGDVVARVGALAIGMFLQCGGQHPVARGRVAGCVEDGGHPGRHPLGDIRFDAQHRVQVGRHQRMDVLGEQIGVAVGAEGVDQRHRDLLDDRVHRVQIHPIDGGDVGGAKTRMLGTRIAQRIRAPLEHRQNRAVGRYGALPGTRVGREMLGIVEYADGGLIADHQCGRHSGGELDRSEGAVVAAHSVVSAARVGGEFLGVDGNTRSIRGDR
ncbi:hypothetical protein [Nocardia elegans]